MSKGITLIEVIIGLAIISFGILSVIAVFPIGLRTLDMNQKSNTALFLASSQIEASIGKGYDNLEEGVSVEDFGEIDDFENYKRETSVSCLEGHDNCFEESGIKKIEVTVFIDGLIQDEVELTTLISDR